MQIKIDDITKGTFRLPTPINNQDGRLKIGVKSVGYWVGLYNIFETQICRYGRDGEDSKEFKIKAGLYNFKELSRTLKRKVEGLNITLDKITGLIDLTIPDGVELWLTEAVRYLIGINDNEWLRGDQIGDRPVEFLPTGGISIYLNELSTDNLTNTKNNLVKSRLLNTIPMLSENFGQYVYLLFENPTFLNLETREINEFEFELKTNWSNGIEHSLNNNKLPISLELEIIET